MDGYVQGARRDPGIDGEVKREILGVFAKSDSCRPGISPGAGNVIVVAKFCRIVRNPDKVNALCQFYVRQICFTRYGIAVIDGQRRREIELVYSAFGGEAFFGEIVLGNEAHHAGGVQSLVVIGYGTGIDVTYDDIERFVVTFRSAFIVMGSDIRHSALVGVKDTELPDFSRRPARRRGGRMACGYG